MKGETKQNKGINIDRKELVIALNELEKEKGIKKDYMLESIETALVTAYKRNYDSNADNVKVTMHPESGEIHVIAEMEVVETVEDDKTQINLEDAKKVNKNLEVGDTAQVEIIPRTMPEKTDDTYLPYNAKSAQTTPMPSFGEGFNIHVTGLTHDERGYPNTDDADVHTQLVTRLCDKILKNRNEISQIESEYMEDADTVVLSYGIPSRSALTAVKQARERDLKVGYIKLGVVWPFPEEQLLKLTQNAKRIIVPELNLGQVYLEVDRVLGKHANVELLSKIGGALHTPKEILDKIMEE